MKIGTKLLYIYDGEPHCKIDAHREQWQITHRPKVGDIVTVRSISETPSDESLIIRICVEEVINPTICEIIQSLGYRLNEPNHPLWATEMGFGPHRFIELDDLYLEEELQQANAVDQLLSRVNAPV